MTQKIDPFIKGYWGWSSGESGWGEAMNYNLIIQAFLQNKRINSVLSSAALLPASPVDGDVFFAVADKTIYLRADGVWYTFLPTVGMSFILKATEEVVKFNGTTLATATKEISEINGLTAALAAKVATTSVGAASGVAPLGVDGKVPSSYLPASGSYLGTWNASTNTPTIVSSTGSNGDYYIVSIGGSTSINGTNSWSIGDQIRFNGSVWQRIPNTSAVASVNGYTGTVVLTNTDVGAAATSHTHADATTSVSGFMSGTDKTKINGISAGATANSTDAVLLARANHTGTQAQSTVVNLVSDLAAKQATLVSATNIKTINGVSILGAGDLVVTGGGGGSSTFLGLVDTPSTYTGNAAKVSRVNAGETALEFVALGTAAFNNTGDFANSSHTHAVATTSLSGFLSSSDKIKLDGISAGATANSSDATLLNRANHTGTQAQSTITNLVSDLALKAPLITPVFANNIVINAASGQAVVVLQQAGVENGRISAAGGAGTDITIWAQRFLTLNPTSNFSINYAGVPKLSVDPTGLTTIVDGSGIANLNASNLGVGTVPLTRLPAASAYIGYTPVNKAGDTGIGALTATSFTGIGTGLTALNANNITTGTLPAARVAGSDYVVHSLRLQAANSGDSLDFTVGASNYTSTFSGAVVRYFGSTVTGNIGSTDQPNANTGMLLFQNLDRGFITTNGSQLYLGANLLKSMRLDNGGNITLYYDMAATNISLSGTITGSGSGLTTLNASNISSGTLASARLPFVVSQSSSTTTVVQRDGAGNIYAAAYIGDGANLTGLNASNIASGTLAAARLPFNYSVSMIAGYLVQRDASGFIAAARFDGSGLGLTDFNASIISTGTVPSARLPSASTSAAGIVQLTTSTSSISTVLAPTASALKSVQDQLNTVSSIQDTQITYPSQDFVSLGSVSGAQAPTANHVLATAVGNITWTFTNPTSSKASAITLELTNGGAYTMTWPSGTRWTGGGAPTLTASGTDILVFTKAGTNAWRGYLSSKDNR